MSEKSCPPSAALLGAWAMAKCLEAEIACFVRTRTALPHDRVAEIFDCVFPLVSEWQKQWARLPETDLAALVEARRAMFVAIRRVPFMPTSFSEAPARRTDRQATAPKPAPQEPPKQKPTSVAERGTPSIVGLRQW